MVLEIDTEILQLRWQCRRGMLELDLMLGAFLDKAYSSLQDPARADFKKLLALPDQTLYEWFMGQTVPEEGPLAALVIHIRHVLSEEGSTTLPSAIIVSHV